MTISNEQTTLYQSLVKGKSELEQTKLRLAINKAGIDDNDPVLLLLEVFTDYHSLTGEMSQTITKVKQLIDQKTMRLETLVETFVESASTLDNRLKGQVPRSLRNSGLMIRELVAATLIAFLAGGLFFRPLVNLAASKLCANVPKVCEVNDEKQQD